MRKIDIPQVLYCHYCNKQCKSLNSLRQHEIRCKCNPNRKISGIEKYNNSDHSVWNKGLTKQDDSRIFKFSEQLKEKYKSGELIAHQKGKSHTKEEKEKISKSRKKFLNEHPEMVPFKLNHSSKISYPEQYFIDLFDKEQIDLKYHKQVSRYELDFYNENLKKYVEIDGEQHYSDYMLKHDKERETFLLSLGWIGIRIRWSYFKSLNNEQKQNEIEKIKDFLKS